MKTTIEIQRGWLEGLLDIRTQIDAQQLDPAVIYPFSRLLGYIESAKYLLPEQET